MEKEFIPYEQALYLKELGFDEPCFATWIERDKRDGGGIVIEMWGDEDTEYSLISEILAPTFSQAFRWFREKYLLFGYSFPNDYQKYGYRIVEMTSNENKELVYDWGTKDSVEEAELECLKKLIKIVKRK